MMGVSNQHQNSSQVLEVFQDAIKGIPFHEKTGYLEALDKSPHLIGSESDPFQLLQFEQYDVCAAAKRLVAHWEWRTLLFGERAFLPLMDLSGRGALADMDIEYFKSGMYAVLPKTKEGNSVLFLDRSKLRFDILKEDQMVPLRVLFYYFCFFCYEQKDDPRNAEVVILNLVSNWSQKTQGNRVDVIGIIKDSMPLRLKCMHLVFQSNGNEEEGSWAQTIHHFIDYYSKSIPSSKFFTHFNAGCKESLKVELMTYGFLEDGIPESLGGRWLDSNFYEKFDIHRTNETSISQTVQIQQPLINDVDEEAVVSLLNDSIDLMQHNQKSAYQEALTMCPKLVQQESNPIEFLRFENFDIWKASHRLAKYWECRRSIFQERAFLPIMDLSGSGALQKSEVGLAKSGVFAILPKDANGDLVGVFDRSRIETPLSQLEPNMVKRFFFWCFEYMRSELRRPENHEAGIGMINIVQSSLLPRWIFSGSTWTELYNEAMPVKYTWFRLVLILKDVTTCNNWRQTILPLVQSAMMKAINCRTIRIHCDSDVKVLKTKLFKLGLKVECLPETIGGIWSYNIFNRWIQDLARLESQDSGDVNKMKSDPMEIDQAVCRFESFEMSQGKIVHNDSIVQDNSLLSQMGKLHGNFQATCGGGFRDPNSFNGPTHQTMQFTRNETCEMQVDDLPWDTLSQISDVARDEGGDLISYDELFPVEDLSTVLDPFFDEMGKEGNSADDITDKFKDQHPSETTTKNPPRVHRNPVIADALKQLPHDEKATIVEADHVVPGLVDFESDGDKYLKLCNSDVVMASKLFAYHWEMRKKVFGDRRFLPMIQTGDGTLQTEDIKTLNTGFLMVLPPDRKGRCVLCCEVARANGFSSESIRRCLFYVLFLLVEGSSAIQNGIAMLILMRRKDIDCLSDDLTYSDILQAFPLGNVIAFHVIRDATVIGLFAYEELVEEKVKQLLHPLTTEYNLRYHRLGETLHLREALLQSGILLKNLPVTVGGAWTDECFLAWQQGIIRHQKSYTSS